MSKKVNPFTDSTTKRECRTLVRMGAAGSAPVTAEQFMVWEMPGSSTEFARDTLKMFPSARFIGVERDAEVFAAMQTKLTEEGVPLTLLPEDAYTYWQKRPPVDFDCVWLDLCGPWHIGLARIVANIFRFRSLNYRPGYAPIFALTLALRRDHPGLDDLFQRRMPKNWAKDVSERAMKRRVTQRIEAVYPRIQQLANAAGQSVEPLYTYQYKDCDTSSNPTPMVLFVFKAHPEIRQFEVGKHRIRHALVETVDQMHARTCGARYKPKHPKIEELYSPVPVLVGETDSSPPTL